MRERGLRQHRLRQDLLVFAALVALPALPRCTTATVRLVPDVYPTIQEAIDQSVHGDTVLILPGVYRGPGNRDIELRGKGIVVTSRDGAETTVIDCEDGGRGFHVHEWESTSTRIERLTIVNGNAGGGDGGGIYCDIASPMVLGCRILNSRAHSGGGLALSVFGGVVDGCFISGNWTDDTGGGLYVDYSLGVTISNCVITGNTTTGNIGGGVSFQTDVPDVLRGCTISGNTCGQRGGGVFTGQDALIDRCAIWGNCAPAGGSEVRAVTGVHFTCSCVDSAGVETYRGSVNYDPNCVFTDPLFCDPVGCSQTTEGDWRLASDSPCLPEFSPCGQLIGALGQGCGPSGTAGACCFFDGSCLVLSPAACAEQQGTYVGDDTECEPNPCQPTPMQISSWGRIKVTYR